MRFVRTATPQGARVGVLLDDDTVAISASIAALDGHLAELPQLGAAIASAPDSVRAPYASLDLLKVVDPPSLRDFMVFEEHVLPGRRRRGYDRAPDVWYQQPIGYFSNVATLRGPHEPIEIPGDSRQLDFELEVAAVTSRPLASVLPEEAEQAIADFLVLCDWSARDIQAREMDGRLGPHKGKDFATSLGPILVTPDELADVSTEHGYDLRMTATVNEREYGADRWSSASWSFGELISFASLNSAIDAGALFGSGTCQGGCILEQSLRHSPEQFPWLAAGDRVQLGIQRLGELSAEILPATRGAWPAVRAAAGGEGR
jgi:2-keto-4-pentenoate hydratase/2-oxohepta-3-ene-1,7-dioic acid hydratase in catechol pathway